MEDEINDYFEKGIVTENDKKIKCSVCGKDFKLSDEIYTKKDEFDMHVCSDCITYIFNDKYFQNYINNRIWYLKTLYNDFFQHNDILDFLKRHNIVLSNVELNMLFFESKGLGKSFVEMCRIVFTTKDVQRFYLINDYYYERSKSIKYIPGVPKVYFSDENVNTPFQSREFFKEFLEFCNKYNINIKSHTILNSIVLYVEKAN